MISFRYHHANLIAKYLWKVVVSRNLFFLGAAVATGMTVRVFTLLGFVVTLQSIVAAIRPQLMVNYFKKAFMHLGLGDGIDSSNVLTMLIVTILLVFGLNLIVQVLHSKFVGRLNLRSIERMQSLIGGKSNETDSYIIDKVPATVQAFVTCCVIGLLMLFLLVAISFITPMLGLLILPSMVLALVLVQVLSDRGKLRRDKELWDARQKYSKFIALSAEKEQSSRADKAKALREYEAVQERLRHIAAVRPQISALIGAIAICAIIYHLFTLELKLGQLAGMLIVFVVGIRYIISYSREFSTNFSRILELRSRTEIMRAVLEANPRPPELQDVQCKSQNAIDGSVPSVAASAQASEPVQLPRTYVSPMH